MQNVIISAKKNMSMGLFIVFSLMLYVLSGFTHTAQAEERWVDKSSQFDIKLLNPIRSRRFTYALSPVELTNLGETLTGKHRLVITSLWPENIIIEGAELDQNGVLFIPFENEIISGSTTKVTLKFLDAARQSFGYEVQVQQLDTSIALPPNPKDIAPALNPTKVVNFKDAVEFLFTGDNPIQTGVNASDIIAKRVAVVRGQVLNKDNTPLSGVTITIKDHTEYGQTLSRADGWFDMAVNGGDYVTINYTKQGYLPVQRQIKTPWRDYAMPEDIVMISLDPQVTTIDLTSNQAVQVAQGSMQTDADGERQATVFFPKGTSATMVMPDGSNQSLTTLNVRATEYTVGENGPNRMPGELPLFSGYTYAIELSVDEAIATGATRVDFNQEIPVYIDNFLGFPTGEIVPLGWYNYETSTWIAARDGRVIKILSISDGIANLDIDGSDTPANNASLMELGITDAERNQLALTFNVGDTLSRISITHFTPWDPNYPHGPPSDAIAPIDSPPVTENTIEVAPEDTDECQGCIIEAQSQTLSEIMPITGSDISLRYRSDRMPDRKTNNTLSLPLTGDFVPDSLLSVFVSISIAGQRHFETFPAIANQNFVFTWDGLDGYGRPIQAAKARIFIGYRYPLLSGSAAQDTAYNFNSIRSRTKPMYAYGNGRTYTIMRRWAIPLSSPIEAVGNINTAAAGLGGWSISNMHTYDINNQELLKGDGNKRTTNKINDLIVMSEAGTGINGFSGDNFQASKAQLSHPSGIAVDSAGNIYFVDSNNNRIRKINNNGIITTVAGNGVAGYSGDGGYAIDASFNISHGGITVVNDEIYVADTNNHRIRKIDTNGIVTTIAGNRALDNECELDCLPMMAPLNQQHSDATLAIETDLNFPSDIKVAANGTLYIVDANRISTVAPNGIIRTIVGDGSGGVSEDGLITPDFKLNYPFQIILANDNSFFFSETGSNIKRIRHVGSDGVVSTVVGGGRKDDGGINGIIATDVDLQNLGSIAQDQDGKLYFVYEGNKIYQVANDGIIRLVAGSNSYGYSAGLALGAQFFNIAGIALDQDNNIHIADRVNHRIRTVTQAFPHYSNADQITIPNKLGTELYIFNKSGQHLKTINIVSGTELFKFTYTANGYLNSIIDKENRITLIERGNENNPISITTPDGQKTVLSTSNNGYLSKITNPQGETDTFNYTNGGLMIKHTNPQGHASSYFYDSLGRLQQDVNPEGGGWSLEKTTEYSIFTRNGKDVNFLTKMTSAEEREYQFQVKSLPTGERLHQNTAPDGSIKTTFFANEGIQTISYANGNSITSQNTGDPRFGMLSPTLKSSILTTPNGLTKTILANKEATLADTSDLLSHTSLRNTVIINGNEHTRDYDTASRTWSYTSPEGRTSAQIFDANGRIIESAVSNLSSTNFIYNVEGRVSNITQGSGVDSRETSLAYYNSGAQQGFLESITDAANRETSFSYDNAGRLLTQTLPNGNDINFNYDANGNITSITPANNEAHSFEYTKVDETSDYTPPDVAEIAQPSTQYSYNLDKQLELISLPDEQEVDYVYHPTKGHKIQTKIPRGDFDYAYNVITGQIEQVTAPDGGKIVFAYDGSLVLSAQLTGTVSGKVNQVYNNDFQVIQRCANTRDCIDFSYDNDLLLVQAGSLTINRAAQKGGLITGTSLGNISTSNMYNDFGEPLSVSTNDTDVYSVDYTRDKLGRITQKVETLQGVTTTFDYDYDLLGQLSTVKTNDIVTSNYSFDDNGNRTHINGVTIATFDAQDRLKQHLTNNGDNKYTYTDNGDLVSKTNTVTNKTSLYHYDVLGNLISAAIPDDNSPNTTQIEYIIDAQNRRVGKKINDTLTQGFLYKDQLNPIAELDGNGAIVSRFVYGSKAFVPDYMVKYGKTYRIISDHLGSPRLVINTSDSTIAQRLDYDVWGNITLDTNPGFQPFGFAGGLYDQHTKLTRFGARDYDAEVGRWTTKDPIGLNGGLNVYGYVGGDPVNGIDPEGKFISVVVSCVVSAVGGYISADRFKGNKKNKADNKNGNSCPTLGDTNPGLVKAANSIKNASGANSKQFAGGVAGLALAGAGVVKAGPACGLVGAALGLAFGDGSVAAAFDSFVGSLF